MLFILPIIVLLAASAPVSISVSLSSKGDDIVSGTNSISSENKDNVAGGLSALLKGKTIEELYGDATEAASSILAELKGSTKTQTKDNSDSTLTTSLTSPSTTNKAGEATSSTSNSASTSIKTSKASSTPTAKTLKNLAASAPQPYESFQGAFNATYSTFWSFSQNGWSESSCGTFTQPVVWNSAVAGLAASLTNNPYLADQAAQQLLAYRNAALGGFSSSTNKDADIYLDDTAQVAWVYLKAHSLTNKAEYLSIANSTLAFIKSQWSSKGGVSWLYKGDYVASISTLEAALASVLYYTETGDQEYLSFSKDCLNWAFDNLYDSLDNLFYDGLTISSGNVNKGKLSYTVGTALSTLSHLYKIEGDLQWLTKAETLIKASATGSGALYNLAGYWNNPLKYLYLLFQGCADFATYIGSASSLTSALVTEVNKQGNYVYNYLQDGTSGFYYDNMLTAPTNVYQKYLATFGLSAANLPEYCSSGVVKRSLLTNAAASIVFYNQWRV